jgi:hypothetical protein
MQLTGFEDGSTYCDGKNRLTRLSIARGINTQVFNKGMSMILHANIN